MDEESDNFYRISSLLLDVGTITLREKLRCTFAPQSFHDFLRAKIHDIFHLYNRGKCRHCKTKTERVIYKAQWDLLFQSSSTPCPVSGRLDDCYCSCIPSPHIDLDKLDITLISCLLLNTVNLDQPQKNLVKNLREARNEVFGHSPKAKLSEAEFGKYWTIATDNIDQIAATCGAQFVIQTRENMMKIRSKVLDKEFCQNLLNIIQNSQVKSDAILKSLEASESKITGAVQDEGNMISAAVQEEGNKISDAVQEEGSKIMGAVKEEGSKLMDNVKEEGSKITCDVKEEGSKISGAVKAEGNKIMAAVKEEGNRISGAVKEEGSKIMDSVSEERSKIAGVVKEEGGKITGVVKEEGGKITDAVQEEGSKLASAVQEEGNKITSAVKVNEERITGAVQKEGNRIANALQEEGHKIMSSVQLEGRSVADTVQKEGSMIFDAIQEEGHRVIDTMKNVATLMEERIMGRMDTRVQTQLQSIDLMIGQKFREDTEQSRALTEKERRRMEAIETSKEEIEGIVGCRRTHFVHTRAFQAALDQVKGNTRFLIFTGLPGDGKTTLGIFTVNALVQQKEGLFPEKYPLIISNPKMWRKLVSRNSNLVIFIDNMFGTFTVHQQLVSEWEQIFPHMCACLRDVDNPACNYVIVGMRKEVFSYVESTVLPKLEIFSEECVIDLQSQDHCLVLGERKEIFYSFPKNKSIPDKEVTLICNEKSRIGFPVCCKLLSSSKSILTDKLKYFQKPREFLESEFKRMLHGTEGDKIGFCALSLVMFMDGEWYASHFRVNTISDDNRRIFQSSLKMCGLDPRESLYTEVLDRAHMFDGVYLKYLKSEDAFVFEHDCLNDIMAMLLFQRDPEIVIRHCRVNFFSFMTCKESNASGVFVHPNLYPCIIDRIARQIQGQIQRNLLIALAEFDLWTDIPFQEMFKKKFLSDTLSIIESITDQEGETALMACAAGIGAKFLICFLLEYHTQQGKHLALNKSAETGQREVFDFLLQHDKPDVDTALSAVLSGNVSILTQVIDKCTFTHEDTCKVFFHACKEFRPSVIQYLCNKYPGIVHEKDDRNWTVLHWAVKHGSLEYTKFFVKSGLSPYDVTVSQMNLLHIASKGGHLELVKYLAEKYKDLLEKTDEEGKSVLHFAAMSGNDSMVEFLMDSGIDVFALTDIGQTVLHKACENGHIRIVTMLARKNERLLKMNDKNNNIPLHHAAASGNVSLVQFLIDNGLDVFAVNSNGLTVMHVACIMGQRDVVKMLANKYEKLLKMSDKNTATALHHAAGSGNISLMQFLIDTGLDVFTDTDIGRTILHAACSRGHLDVVKMLASKYEGLLKISDKSNFTPLHSAACSGNVSLVQFLIDTGLNVFAVNNYGISVLHVACCSGQIDVAKMLASNYERLLKMSDKDNRTVLHYAAYCGNVSLVLFLIDTGLDVFAVTTGGLTVLHEACNNGQIDVVKMLVNKYEKLLKMSDKNNETALHYAAVSGNVSLVQFLIDTGLDVFAVTTGGLTVLHAACYRGQIDVVEILTSKYTKLLKMNDKFNRTPLHRAAGSGNISLVQFLIDRGLNAFAVTTDGLTVLHVACYYGQIDVVKMLANKYEQLLKMSDKKNNTALHHAVYSGNVSLMQFLIDTGLDVFADTGIGRTILHVACSRGQLDVVKMLASKYEVLLKISDKSNYTPLHRAACSGNVSMIQFLIDTGLNVYAVNNYGVTVLHAACCNGQTDAAKMLASNYERLLKMSDKNKRTALHYAAYCGNVSLVLFLIDTGMDVFAVATDGLTVLHAACINGQIDLVKMLVSKYGRLLKMSDKYNSTALHHAYSSGNVSLVQFLIATGLKSIKGHSK